MGRRRLFIGNLPNDTQRGDLESVFSTAGYSALQSVEIRTKNEATFAFVDLDCGDENQLTKCMDNLNKLKVKGQVLKVQMAKENFMERLQKEREGLRPRPPLSFPPQSDRNSYQRDPRRRQESYDFEIVSIKPKTLPSSSTKSQKNSNGKKNLDSDSDEESSDDENEKGGIPMFRGLGFYPGLQQPNSGHASIRPLPKLNHNQVSAPLRVAPKISEPSVPAKVGPAHDRIAQRMLAIASNKQLPPRPLSGTPIQDDKTRPIMIPSRPFSKLPEGRERMLPQPPSSRNEPTPPDSNTPASPTSMLQAGGLKLNPRKIEKSDQLRQQSFESRHQLQQSRLNLIRNSLSNNSMLPQQRKSETENDSQKPKKPKTDDFLFGNGDDDLDGEDDFAIKVKPQYEGAAGQKMLELNANFAWDKRFQIDSRFADDESAGIEDPESSEKNTQFEILGQIIGKSIQIPQKKQKVKVAEDTELVRYDPTRVEHRVFEVNTTSNGNVNFDNGDNKVKSLKSVDIQAESNTNSTKAAVPPPPPTQEKPTFKVAENLKNLFVDSGFSLLGAFGQSEEPKISLTTVTKNGDTKTRSFWNKNPFKYDSSDDEEGIDGTGQKKNNGLKMKRTDKGQKLSSEKERNYFKEDVFKRERFFFSECDERLANVFTDFLAVGADEDLEEVRKKFNELGRTELKTIAKNKRKNSLRKNEKRVRIMRLIRRKKRREAKQKREKAAKVN